MKPQQRSFVVEIKSARRQLKTRPKSIWGETDFGALVREAEAKLPFMQNAVSQAPISRIDQPFEPEDATDIHEAGENQLSLLPSTGPDDIRRHQQEQACLENTAFHPAEDKFKPKMAGTLKHGRRSQLENARGRNSAPAATVKAASVDTHIDELPLLDAENRRLKQLLAEHLKQQNAQLRAMLKRFEGR